MAPKRLEDLIDVNNFSTDLSLLLPLNFLDNQLVIVHAASTTSPAALSMAFL